MRDVRAKSRCADLPDNLRSRPWAAESGRADKIANGRDDALDYPREPASDCNGGGGRRDSDGTRKASIAELKCKNEFHKNELHKRLRQAGADRGRYHDRKS